MFQNLKSLFSVIFLAGLFVCSPSSYAAELHAVLVGDTTDDSLGIAFQKDLDIMQEEMKKIAKQTNLKLDVVVLQGNAVTPNKVLRQIESLQIKPDDVVVLYFTIHGFRTSENASQWPSLFFGVSQQGVDFESLNEVVKNKHPRLSLSIADSCNNQLEGYVPMVWPKLFNQIQTNAKKVQANYRKLFLESRGSILISSSIPGQYSWYYTQHGGIFTLKFLEALKEGVQMDQGIDWSNILETANIKVANETANIHEIQTPQFELNLTE